MSQYWTEHADHDADTIAGLPSAEGRHRMYGTLASDRVHFPVHFREPEPEPEPAVMDAPRPAQVVKALARLIDRVEKCEADEGPLRLLSKYVAACVPGRANAYANLRPFRSIQDDVNEATETLHLGGDRGVDAFIDAALARHGYPDWPNGGAS